MKFSLNLKLDNSAFEESNTTETARILRELANKIETGSALEVGDGGKAMDLNGNKVGEWTISE